MDLLLARICNRLGAPTIDPATEFICEVTFLLALWSALLLAVWVFARDRARAVTVAVIAALVLHGLCNELLLKHVLLHFASMRVRPYLAHPGEIVAVGYRFRDASFPSSHAASTAALATVYATFFRGAWPAAAGFTLVMAFARVHNGMHYPTDVLTGMALGVAYGVAAVYLLRRWRRDWIPAR